MYNILKLISLKCMNMNMQIYASFLRNLNIISEFVKFKNKNIKFN